MGIDTKWKPILEINFGYCNLESLPKDTNIDVVIDDFSLNIRKIFYGINSWEELTGRVKSRIISKLINSNVKTYFILFDEPEYVPPNKASTQKKRLENSIKYGKSPFNDTEIESIKISIHENTKFPEELAGDNDLFIKRLMETRKLYPQLISLCCHNILICEMPYPIEIIIHGGYVNDIIQTKNIIIQNYSTTATTTTTTNHAKFITINNKFTSENQQQQKIIHIQDSPINIGESDFKIPYNIPHIMEGNIYIRSNDTDTICILLLHMRSWINPLTGKMKYGIFVDTEQNSKDNTIIDMVSLWRKILIHFRDYYPGIKFPIETLVILILISGSDYIAKNEFPQIGPAIIWKSFIGGGHKILYPHSKEYVSTETMNIDDSTIIMDSHYGNPEHRYGIQIAEHRIYQFIGYIYYKHIMKTNFPKQGIINLNEIRTKAKQIDSTRKEGYKWNIVDTDEEMYAKIRRMYWNLDYLINGSKKLPFMDPLLIDSKTNKSIYGWERDYQQETAVRKFCVKTAKIVHRITN